MRIETYLNAMVMAGSRKEWIYPENKTLLYPRSERQYRAFRARILRMFEEQERTINTALIYQREVLASLKDLHKQVEKQELEIARLKDEIEDWMDDYNTLEMEREME